VNLYISDSTGVIARDNEIYTTASSPVEQDPTGPKVGILMGDERCGPCSEDIQVLNNHVTGARCNLYIGYSYNPDGTNADLVITGNTFEESTYQAGVRVNSYASESWPGFVFENNTIIQTNGLPLISDAAGIIDESINTIVTGNAPPTMMPLQRTDHFHQH
jgi:hypothetical protein